MHDIYGFSGEVDVANKFLAAPENKGKEFKASTETYHFGSTAGLPIEIAFDLLKSSLDKVRVDLV